MPTAFKVAQDIAESFMDVPYAKTVAGLFLQILEIREQVKDNKDLTDHLVHHVAEQSVVLLQALQRIKEQTEMGYALQRYEKLLIEIHAELEGLAGLRKIRAIINRDDIKKQLQDYARRLTDFDAIFNFSRLTNIETIVRRIDARDTTTTVHGINLD